MNEFEPKQFGKYYLLEKLAVGGMAEIYKAKTFGVDGFEKELAIKRILPHCSADKDFITMLIDEAKLSVMLSHANIVQVYDLGKVSDDYFISMEFIHGVNLRDIMYRCREDKIPIPADIAVYIISEICKGLDYAHRKTDQHNQPLGIVHRDVSPQNILLSYEGEVKIVDFGIAKAAMNISHTMAGILKGKIAYMSPEQAMGKSIDRRTDIFSTGILLYEMVTGTKLYTGESQFEVLKKIRTTRVTVESLPDSIPAALKSTIAKALAYNVDDRFQHAGDLQIELTKFLYSTYSDFSPRRLAAFIDEVFQNALVKEQVEKAREVAFEQQTSSMSIGEGAKQLDIVHRETSFGQTEDTARGKGTREAFMETVVTPGRQGVAQTPLKESPTESRTMRRGRGWFSKSLAIILVLGMAGYAAYRYLPTLKFWDKPAPAPPVQVPATVGSARITTTPEGAKVSLDGQLMDQTTPVVIENLGLGKTYTFRFDKEGFSPTERKVTITSAEPVDINLELPALTGILNIITDPPGAAIMIEGKLTGLTTPATVENIPINKDQRITLSKPDYEDFEQAVNLTSTKPQKLSTKLKALVPQSGKMTITSNPPGASVALNGKDTGRTTPATIANLEPQKYSVTLAMQGYDTWSGSFDVAADATVPVEAALNKTEAPAVTEPPVKAEIPPAPTPPVAGKATLKVQSSPDGARISLNGAGTGRKTPATLDDLKIGASYNIRFDLEGYKSVTRKKAIQKQSETLYAALTKEEEKPVTTEPPKAEPPKSEPPKAEAPPVKAETGTGSIRIASNPSGADVFINSEHRGRTPLTVNVPSGSVNVLVGKEGMGKFSRQVTVRPGQTVNLTDISLGDAFGEVSLSSDPPRAQVIFDGQAIPAPTPVTVRRVKRDQQHSVTIQMPGYKSWSRSFSMDEASKSFNATLQPQ